jgi:methionine sulfoxide reductase heme-binding subunit
VRFVRVLKPIVFLAALAPAGWLAWAALTGNLSANPLSDLTNETGVWTLRFLCITLAITPLRWLTGWNALIRFRRMTGLYAFFYGSLHFLVYLVADRFASLDFPNGEIVVFSSWTARHLVASVWDDIYKRPYITIGFTALMTMVPLTATSTAGMIRRLGGRRWNRLHKLVYLTAALGVVHYYWLVKADVRRPLTYGAIVGVLLAARGWRYLTAMRPSTRGAISRRAAT